MDAVKVPDLIHLNELPDKAPGWPLSPWSTKKLIRDGVLRCVRIGRRIYVTPALLAEFIERQTTKSG